jgi:hypothetical protein
VVIDQEQNAHGLTALSGPTKKTSIAMHYFRFIRPGMVRVGVSGEGDSLGSAAFQDSASGRLVLVLLNRTREASPLSVLLADNANLTIGEAYLTDISRDCEKMDEWSGDAQVTVPAESMVTLLLTPRK